METITKKKLKLKIVDVTKIGDFYERQFSEETVDEIKQYCKEYSDEYDNGENIYNIRNLQDSEEINKELSEEVQAEILELQKVLDKHDCAYMRFIY